MPSVRQLARKIRNSLTRWLRTFGRQFIWLSLGENCLSDDILRRHGKKCFSTPYSHCRTNIDYALALEAEDYQSLLLPSELETAMAFGQSVVRSRHYHCDPIFHPSCSKGFEFSHYDLLNEWRDRESFERKISRLQQLRCRKNVVFLYHHRWTANSNLALLRAKIDRFVGFYTTTKVRCVVVCFYQALIEPQAHRKLERIPGSDHRMEFVFHTRAAWEGNDQDIFWAKVDDDLIGAMIRQIESALR